MAFLLSWAKNKGKTQMKKIPLTRGKFALVDDDDYEELSKYKWRITSNGYALHTGPRDKDRKRKTFLMHRLIMDTPLGLCTDHKNGNKLDNRKENLRICTYSQNNYNIPKKKDNISGCKGVGFHTKSGKYRSRIVVNKKAIHLGLFTKIEDAYNAYCAACKKYHGEFANIK